MHLTTMKNQKTKKETKAESGNGLRLGSVPTSGI